MGPARDGNALPALRDLAADPSDHLRKDNPTDSVFVTVPHTTARTGGAPPHQAMGLTIVKLARSA